MRRGTTPTITINVAGETFENSTVYVTIKQDNVTLTKTNDDLTITPSESDSVIAVFLTQEETLSFTKGKAQLQIRWISASGVAQASIIKTIMIDPILLEGVITYA